jgi:hypothetical protein
MLILLHKAIYLLRKLEVILLATFRMFPFVRIESLLISSRSALYPPASYTVSEYAPLPITLYPISASPAASYPSYETLPGLAPPGAGAVPGNQSNGVMPRILNSRPKPQCWEHGCNGRQFSTFSNLKRHQREKSGAGAKSYCPRCGADFTRNTARNLHIEKCKSGEHPAPKP